MTHSGKISLRELNEKDIPYMLEWMHDKEIQKCFRFDAAGKTEADVKEFIESSRMEFVQNGTLNYAVVNENDEYLGTISLKNLNLVSKNAEYAVSLRAKAQGKGIGMEATRLILKIAFEDLELNRVYLNVLTDNLRANRMYEKVGFRFEGEFTEHLFLRGEYHSLKWYGMLKQEYDNLYREVISENGGIL